ncbi:hypothetical protein [Nocardia sp. NPDC051570]|uniref:hypothetical protein n=1 Tax=Nocardia sp. NPDC051570 TaxID=3364324 RepID=UPI0037909505
MANSNPGIRSTGRCRYEESAARAPLPEFDSRTEPLAIPAIVLGVALVIAALASLDHLPRWAADYSAILVYCAFFLYMSLAGRLTWWGVDTVMARIRTTRRSRR